MEKADLTEAILDGAQLGGVKMLRAVLENASLKGCNFELCGTNANMEGDLNFRNKECSETFPYFFTLLPLFYRCKSKRS